MLYDLKDDGTIVKINSEDSKDLLIKRIDETIIDEYRVSTVFLGIDHNYSQNDDPILFETMIFSKYGADVYMDRCRTLEEAKIMHERGIIHAKYIMYCDS